MEDAQFTLESIRVSPDGSRVAYASFAQGRSIQLNVVDRSGRQQSLGLVSGQTSSNRPNPLCWTPDGKEIWFSSFESNEARTVYGVNLKGRRRIVANLPSRVSLYDIASSGEVLLSSGSTRWGILGAGPGDTEERDLSCLDTGVLAGISNDGTLIAASVAGESGGLKGSVYIRKTDGSPPVRLDDGQAYQMSPSGQWVSGYIPDDHGSRRFVLLPTGPGEPDEVKVPGVGQAPVVGWLPGERGYVAVGRLPGKPWQCFAVERAGWTVRPVCPEGTPDRLEIYVSPDGKRVLSQGPKGGWFAYAVDGGPAEQVQGLRPDEEPFGWRSDCRSVYVKQRRAGDTSTPVWIVEIGSGRRSMWKEIRPTQPVDYRYDLHLQVTPDGRAYAYNFSLELSDLYVSRRLE